MLVNLTLQKSLSLNSHPYTVNSTGDPNLSTLTIGTVYDNEYPISFQQLFLLNFGNSIPKGAIIQSAKIAVKMNSRSFTLGGTGHNFSIAFNALANDWNVSTTKWGNRPASLAGNSFLLKNEDLNVVREYDVTDMLQVLINNGTDLVFQTTGSANFSNNAYAQYMGAIGHADSPQLIVEYITNKAPIINVTSPAANQTIHEKGILAMSGSTTDTDVDNVVTVKYQIDSGTVRNLHSAVSDGVTPINFMKSLTYKDGALYDGATAVTSTLDKDVPHTVSMWVEDENGGKSSIVTRTFFVVPNRPPGITINPIGTQSDLINSNVINVSGAVTDADNNDVTVTFSINGAEEQQVYQGPPSSFTFNILLANLKVGANTVIVKATDTYNTYGTKTLTINKTHNAVPVNKAVARYAIQAPTGSAKSILLWITRTLGNLGITAEVSLTNAGERENYVELDKTNSAVVNGLKEEEYAFQGSVDKEKIILKITYDRTDTSVIDTIKQISGVLF